MKGLKSTWATRARQTNGSDDPRTWEVRSIPFEIMVEGDNALI
jgi:hypothetical protein